MRACGRGRIRQFTLATGRAPCGACELARARCEEGAAALGHRGAAQTRFDYRTRRGGWSGISIVARTFPGSRHGTDVRWAPPRHGAGQSGRCRRQTVALLDPRCAVQLHLELAATRQPYSSETLAANAEEAPASVGMPDHGTTSEGRRCSAGHARTEPPTASEGAAGHRTACGVGRRPRRISAPARRIHTGCWRGEGASSPPSALQGFRTKKGGTFTRLVGRVFRRPAPKFCCRGHSVLLYDPQRSWPAPPKALPPAVADPVACRLTTRRGRGRWSWAPSARRRARHLRLRQYSSGGSIGSLHPARFGKTRWSTSATEQVITEFASQSSGGWSRD